MQEEKREKKEGEMDQIQWGSPASGHLESQKQGNKGEVTQCLIRQPGKVLEQKVLRKGKNSVTAWKS